MVWRERDGVRWLEAKLDGATAAFSTRVGGVSPAPYESLNVAIKTGDDRGRVRDNRARLARAIGVEPEGVLMAHQVHGDRLIRHHAEQEPRIFSDVVPSP